MELMRVTVLALALGTSVVSAPVAAAGNGRGQGPSIPSLPGQAANAPGHSVKPAGVPGIADSVIPGSVPSGGPILIVPAPPSVNGTLPAASAIRLPAATASVATPGGSGPVAAATRAGAMSESVSVKPSAMNDQPTLRSGAPGNHPVRDAVLGTAESERMLPAGHRVELVDPSIPELRVEVTAPPDGALDIKAVLSESRNSGIFAGLSGRHRAPGAQRATVLHDGRIVLVSGRPPDAGKSVDHTHYGHAELRHDKDNHGSREFHQESPRDGEALAQDGGGSSRQHKTSVATKDPAASPTGRRVSFQESAGEDKDPTTIMRSVGRQPPRLCS